MVQTRGRAARRWKSEAVQQPSSSESGPAENDDTSEKETEDPQEAPSEPAAGGTNQAKAKRARYKRDSDMLLEDGQRIVVPPQHNTPVQHHRQRKVLRDPQATEMKINVHPRGQGESDPASSLPPAPVYLDDSCTVSDLQDAIFASCAFLPPKAQKLFSKAANGNFASMDPTGLLSLKDLGFPFPGPHDVWLQCDLQSVYGGPSEGPASQETPVPRRTDKQPAQTPVRSQPRAHPPIPLADNPHSGTPEPIPAAQQQNTAQQNARTPPQPAPVNASSTSEAQVQQSQDDIPEPSEDIPVSPQEKPSPAHYREQTGGRKKNRKWTDQEVEWLLLGIMRFGLSSWSQIAKHWNFQDRTTIDLKDKWRNLVKNVKNGRPMRGMVLTEEARNRIWRIMRKHGMSTEAENRQPARDPRLPEIDVAEA